MNTDNITISLELLLLNELLQSEVIDAALFDKASSKIMKEASVCSTDSPQ